MSQSPNDTTKLLVDYLETCNEALAKHDDETPYKQIIALADDKLAGKELGFAVYDHDPDAPHDFFTVEMSNGKLHFVEHGKRDPDIVWKTPQEYLEKVVDNQQRYIDEPSKLDLDWLKSRVGLG
jgi:hypothetical protein